MSLEILAIIFSIITIILTIIGSGYLFARDIKNDIKADIEKMEKRWEKSEERWEKSDTRWALLFEKFHILDKDIEKFRLPIKKSSDS